MTNRELYKTDGAMITARNLAYDFRVSYTQWRDNPVSNREMEAVADAYLYYWEGGLDDDDRQVVSALIGVGIKSELLVRFMDDKLNLRYNHAVNYL